MKTSDLRTTNPEGAKRAVYIGKANVGYVQKSGSGFTAYSYEQAGANRIFPTEEAAFTWVVAHARYIAAN